MPHFPPVSLPPLTAECETTLHLAQPGTSAKQFASKLFRASDGKIRVDYGEMSVITNPLAQQTITLDHLRKEARMFPMPQEAQPQSNPGGLPVTTLAADSSNVPAPSNVEDLGMRIINGHAAEGKRFTFPLPQLPKSPGLGQPKVPSEEQLAMVPDLPKLQALPRPGGDSPHPGLPPPPKIPQTVEVWTSTNLHLPVLNKFTGSFGQLTGSCRNAATGEPPASLFQIPPHYKLVEMPPV